MAMGVNHICAACIFRHSVHFCLHVQQVLGPIYVDGAIRTAGAKVRPFTTQHACELKCWGDVTLFPYAFRHVPMLAQAHALAHPRIPEVPLFTYLGPHTVLHHFPAASGSPCCPTLCVPGSLLHVATARAGAL